MRKFLKVCLVVLVAIAGIAALGWGALAAPVYEQNYVVEVTITPHDASKPEIVTSEVWSTLVYRDLERLYLVLRVFGEALHFEYDGDDYLLLKRGENGTSAGAFDLLRQCLGITYMQDYQTAGPLTNECVIKRTEPRVVKVDDQGGIEQVLRSETTGDYPEFSVHVVVKPTSDRPSYQLVDRFPWILDLLAHERSTLPVKIPEEGRFAAGRYYQKDFVVSE